MQFVKTVLPKANCNSISLPFLKYIYIYPIVYVSVVRSDKKGGNRRGADLGAGSSDRGRKRLRGGKREQ